MVGFLGIGYEILILILSFLLFFKLLDAQTRYYVLHVATIMLIAEILGSSSGLSTYNSEFFSIYIADTPIIMAFVWFVFVGFATFLSKGSLIYLKAFVAAVFLDLLLEFPMVYYGAWSNNLGNIHLVKGYPIILFVMYGFLTVWFNFLLRHLAPRLEKRKIRSSGLLFAFIFVPSWLAITALLVILIPI